MATALCPTVTSSHAVEPISDTHVVIRNLELFVGYDPEFDGDDERFTAYTDDRIREIVEQTNRYMARGQCPKLILGHNTDKPSDFPRPTIGDIQTVKYAQIGGVGGIVGDVVMSKNHFDAYIASNEYPRRSAEIWLKNSHLSEVALLGSETPARPLPDTRFAHDGERDRFSRVFAAQFAQCEDTNMADTKTDTPMKDDDTELAKAKKEIASLKARLKAMEDGDDEKDKSARAAAEKAEQFKRERDEVADRFSRLEADNAALKDRLNREQFSRQIDAAKAQGFSFGDADQEAAILDRIVGSDKPDDEFAFYKKMAHRDPIGIQPVKNARVAVDAPTVVDRKSAADRAVARCTAEGSSAKYQQYLNEELAASR